MNDEKNILILSDLNTHLESQLVESLNFNPNHVMSIQSFQAEISHAYGDVMRSIIIAIYEYDIEHVSLESQMINKLSHYLKVSKVIQKKLKHSITYLKIVSLSLVVTIFMNG